MAAVALSEPRVALVTGAETPCGTAVCRALAATGWTVAAGSARSAVAAPAGGASAGRIDPLAFDPADADAARAAVAETTRRHGAVSLLVTIPSAPAAAAGGLHAFGEIGPELLGDALRRTLRATVHCARAALPGMLDGGGQIVAVVSAAALDGGAGQAHEAAAEAAVIGLAKGLAREYGRRGIAVNALAPGAIAPERIAASVAFLANEPHYFAGQVLCPSEGRVL